MNEVIKEKKCSICLEEKELEKFRFVRYSKDKVKKYYSCYCKSCGKNKDNWSLENYLFELNEEEITSVKETLKFLEKFKLKKK